MTLVIFSLLTAAESGSPGAQRLPWSDRHSCAEPQGRLDTVKTSNPVLSRLGQAAERERTAGYGPYGPAGHAGYGQPGYGQPYPTADGYPAAPPAVQPMTVDDVVVKTV